MQFPRQPIGQQLARGETLVAPAVAVADGSAAAQALEKIEAVPVIESQQAVPKPPIPAYGQGMVLHHADHPICRFIADRVNGNGHAALYCQSRQFMQLFI